MSPSSNSTNASRSSSQSPTDAARSLADLLRDRAEPQGVTEVRTLARSLILDRGLSLPQPGQGESWARCKALVGLGAFNLSLAKLIESHCDAIAIIKEAGGLPYEGVYAVWASKFGGKFLTAEKTGDRWRIRGELAFASGVSTIDYALVPVKTATGEQLFQIPGTALTAIDTSRWKTAGMKAADTAWVTVEGFLTDTDKVGPENFYLNRRGFWPGGIGVAACWLGGARRIYETWQIAARSKTYADPHEQAALAKSYSALKACLIYLQSLAGIMDDPAATVDVLRREALSIRHLVDEASNQLIANLLRANGPILMVSDAEHSERCLDLQVFTRQCHAEKDLVSLSRELEHLDFKGDWFE